jgi:hypothetical protein
MGRAQHVALIAAVLCGAAWAGGTTLFDASDIVPAAQESRTLSAPALEQIARMRANSKAIRSLQVVRLHREALRNGVLTLVTPAGRTREFVGTLTTPGLPDRAFWSGQDADGVILTMSFGPRSVFGMVLGGGERFHIGSLEADPDTCVMFEVVDPPP